MSFENDYVEIFGNGDKKQVILPIVSNEILIYALELGQSLAETFEAMFLNKHGCTGLWFGNGKSLLREPENEKEASYIINWINRYGMPKIFNQKQEFCFPNDTDAGDIAPYLSSIFVNLFADFCLYLKGAYGFDCIDGTKITKTISQPECKELFRISGKSCGTVMFGNHGLMLIRDNDDLEVLLHDMLVDAITNDTGKQPYFCDMCGKQGIKKNPKQIYCSSCRKKRYQVSRRKKKQEVADNGKKKSR